MAGDDLRQRVADLVDRHPEEVARRQSDGGEVGLSLRRVDGDLHRRRAVDVDGGALLTRQHAREHDVELHRVQREGLRLLDERGDERAATDDDAEAVRVAARPAAVHDQRLVRPDTAVAPAVHEPQHDADDDDRGGDADELEERAEEVHRCPLLRHDGGGRGYAPRGTSGARATSAAPRGRVVRRGPSRTGAGGPGHARRGTPCLRGARPRGSDGSRAHSSGHARRGTGR